MQWAVEMVLSASEDPCHRYLLKPLEREIPHVFLQSSDREPEATVA